MGIPDHLTCLFVCTYLWGSWGSEDSYHYKYEGPSHGRSPPTEPGARKDFLISDFTQQRCSLCVRRLPATDNLSSPLHPLTKQPIQQLPTERLLHCCRPQRYATEQKSCDLHTHSSRSRQQERHRHWSRFVIL